MEERIEKLKDVKKAAYFILFVLGFSTQLFSELGEWAGLPWIATFCVYSLILVSTVAVLIYTSIKLDKKGTLLVMKISALAISGFVFWAWLVVSFIPRMMR